jgi:hypothetical protein
MKSKFKSFILSAVPGLGHIYQGFTTRGAIFLGSFAAIIFLMQFLEGSGGYHNALLSSNLLHGYRQVLELCLPFIWLASIVDNLVIFDKFRNRLYEIPTVENDTSSVDQLNDLTKYSNRRLVAVLLNAVPGAGHIFLGLKEKGFQLAGCFFVLYFVAEISSIDILNIPVALLWLYSILDTISLTSQTSYEARELQISGLDSAAILSSLKNKLHWIGGILIFLGITVLLNRAAVNFIDPEYIKLFNLYFKDGLVSLILILVGIKLILGKKNLKQVGENN